MCVGVESDTTLNSRLPHIMAIAFCDREACAGDQVNTVLLIFIAEQVGAYCVVIASLVGGHIRPACYACRCVVVGEVGCQREDIANNHIDRESLLRIVINKIFFCGTICRESTANPETLPGLKKCTV